MLEVGQRIDVFRVDDPFCDIWKVGGWYAEKTNDEYNGNKYGRNMISDAKDIDFVPHNNIKNSIVKKGMVKVGTLIITKIK